MVIRNDRQRRAMFARLNQLPIRSNRLPVQFSVVVPSTRLDKKVTAKVFRKRVDDEKRFLSRKFGGDTSVKATGGFVLRKGKRDVLIKEKVSIVESSMTPKKFNENRQSLGKHIVTVKRKWQQNSVLYKIEGETFIFPRQKFIDHDARRKGIIVT